MVDYYSVLLRAVTAPGAGDGQWRRGIYDRARQMLSSRLRALHPQPSLGDIAVEQAALEAAIERIEAELARTDDAAAIVPEEPATESWDEPERGPIPEPGRLSRAALIVLAVVAAALGAGGYVLWTGKSHQAPAIKNEAQNVAPPTSRPVEVAAEKAPAKEKDVPKEKDAPKEKNISTKIVDLAPGTDGGSTDTDIPYVFRRQPTFYRTLLPPGTIVVDKLQHFLYLIRPNNVALRYGIGLGDQCKDVAGLRHIASMAEWPQWQPPPDLLKREPAVMPGGPGNPLGSRLLQLDDGSSRIHGTNAPKTIGNGVAFGCIRLINDDIVDLYGRVQVSTPVVVN